jgi:hypothetical protein
LRTCELRHYQAVESFVVLFYKKQQRFFWETPKPS